jgi:diaminopimelate decarboxylase
LRLTPGIQAHTHEKISTAHEDVKFGFSIASGAAWTAVEQIVAYPELRASRSSLSYRFTDFWLRCSLKVLPKDCYGIYGSLPRCIWNQLPELNLGGGYGIAYLPEDVTVEPADVLPALGSVIRTLCAKLSLDIPSISIEPGRNIVGPSMFTLV